jgi:YidC/Oxa1 family membrane protein insertase
MDIWSLIILNPFLNTLIALTKLIGGNYGLAIIILTIVIRAILSPLMIRQMRSTKAMQSLQPRMQEIQKKYGRNQQKLQQETMKLYKEAGMNPLGCIWPMLIQFPIWIALYQSITLALPTTPESLLSLSSHLYSWSLVTHAIPISDSFLWLNLSLPDPYLVLAIIVGASMWVQQKMVTAPPADPKQSSMNQITTLMMPLIFALFTLSFPSGLALYWAASNIIGIVMQYFLAGGWGYFTPPKIFGFGGPKKASQQADQKPKAIEEAEKKKGFFRR